MQQQNLQRILNKSNGIRMNKDEIEQKAAYFLTCENDGFTKEQKREFDIWIKVSKEHEFTYKKVKKVQSLYQSLSKDIKNEILDSVKKDIKRDSFLRRYKKHAFAATILLFLSIGFFQTNSYLDFNIAHNYKTDKTAQKISLPDGSNIILDAKTILKVHYFKDRRVIDLKEGNVFFNVAKNNNRPFIINTKEIRVQVLGTSFEINNQKEKIDIEVKNGIVSVQKYDKSYTKELVKLTKGRKISFNRSSNIFSLEDIEIKNIASWKNGVLTFNDTTLKEAIDDFKKYKDMIIFLQPDIEKLTITGAFSINDFDKFLYAISQIHTLNITKKAEKIYIYRKN